MLNPLIYLFMTNIQGRRVNVNLTQSNIEAGLKKRRHVFPRFSQVKKKIKSRSLFLIMVKSFSTVGEEAVITTVQKKWHLLKSDSGADLAGAGLKARLRLADSSFIYRFTVVARQYLLNQQGSMPLRPLFQAKFYDPLSGSDICSLASVWLVNAFFNIHEDAGYMARSYSRHPSVLFSVFACRVLIV